MKNICLISIIGFLAIGIIQAKSDIANLGDLKSEVRMELGVAVSNLMPDSEMTNVCNDALYYVSVHIGGVEDTFGIITSDDSGSYAAPDSLVDIIHAYTLSNDATYEIREWIPQYYNHSGIKSGELEEGSEGETPVAYTLWKDRIRLYPVPSRADTIFFDTYVEHRILTADSMTTQIDGRTDEAVVYYALYGAYRYLRMFDVADWYRAKYLEEEKVLKALFATKIEMTPEGLGE